VAVELLKPWFKIDFGSVIYSPAIYLLTLGLFFIKPLVPV
jgi:hypothetical protein